MTVRSQHRRAHPALPALALVAVAVTWGVTFSVVDGASQLIPPADLVAWRFGVATLLLFLVRRGRFLSGRFRRGRLLPAALRRRGIVLGALLGAGFLLQTWAMTDTDATMSGFLIGTLVVLAPIIGWAAFGVRPARATWIGTAVATAGLAMLSLQGGGFGRGEVLTLLAAGLWALHLVLLARWGVADFAFELARIQTATVTAMALLAVLLGGAIGAGRLLPAIPADGETWLSVIFLALPATALAMIALSWGQSRMTAARAAIILTVEPAAAAATAAMLGAELGSRTIIGGSLLVGAMLIVELGPRWKGLQRQRHRAAAEMTSYDRPLTDRKLVNSH